VLNPLPRVVVVGGSLGGLFNAIALREIGCEVEVVKESAGLLHNRGAMRGWEPDRLGTAAARARQAARGSLLLRALNPRCFGDEMKRWWLISRTKSGS
jgi:hypothetical protein